MSQTIVVGVASTNSLGTITVNEEVLISGSNWEGMPPFNPNSVTNPQAIQQIMPLTTTGAKQTLAVPTGAVGVLIQPPSTGTGTLTVATVSTDVGISIHPSGAPTKLWFDSAALPANLYLTGSVNGQGGYTLFWL